jgi:hypothetical protein
MISFVSADGWERAGLQCVRERIFSDKISRRERCAGGWEREYLVKVSEREHVGGSL